MPISFLKRRLKTLVVSTLSTAIGYGIVTEFSSLIASGDRRVGHQHDNEDGGRSPGSVPSVVSKGAHPGYRTDDGGVSGYDRKEFGRGVMLMGPRNTRHEILIMQSSVSPRLSNNGCSVTSGQCMTHTPGSVLVIPRNSISTT